jgi:hypothetical protein
MKRLIIIALLVVGTTGIAQEAGRKHHGNKMEQFTPEQQSQLMLKKMTLELDLNDLQQKEMSSIISDKIAQKEKMKVQQEKGVRPTNDERFAMHMKMLDEQIATKKRVEKILNAKQYEKWTSLKEEHKENRQPKPQRKRQG